MHHKQKKFIELSGHEPSTLDDLATSIITIINNTPDNTRNQSSIQPYKLVGFKWDITYADVVSNSHECPINGVTNWSRNPDLVQGYRGFTGRVWIRFEQRPDGWGSDVFRNTLTYTGTGGWGSYNGPWTKIYRSKQHPSPIIYSYDYSFFLDDFPKLDDYLYKLRNWHILQNKTWNNKHDFEWNDEETAKMDEEFFNIDSLETA